MRKGTVLIVFVLLLGSAAPAQAGHSRGCGTVHNVKGKRDYRVSASNGLRCKFARKWTKRYIRRGKHGRRWSCSRPSGPVVFYCRKGSKFYYAKRR